MFFTSLMSSCSLKCSDIHSIIQCCRSHLLGHWFIFRFSVLHLVTIEQVVDVTNLVIVIISSSVFGSILSVLPLTDIRFIHSKQY